MSDMMAWWHAHCMFDVVVSHAHSHMLLVGIIHTNYRDRRLLAVLSNLAYTAEHILPPLFARFKACLPQHVHAAMEQEEGEIDAHASSHTCGVCAC